MYPIPTSCKISVKHHLQHNAPAIYIWLIGNMWSITNTRYDIPARSCHIFAHNITAKEVLQHLSTVHILDSCTIVISKTQNIYDVDIYYYDRLHIIEFKCTK